MQVFFKDIDSAFSTINIKLTEQQKQQFYNYYTMLIEWNEKFNLTTITDKSDVIKKHFLDSCCGANFIKQNSYVLDIGAGAGFPSLPLKILRPDLKLVLIDSVNKKVTFLQEVINKLNLQNTTALHTRAEDFAKKSEYREGFDFVVSRAVSKLNTLSEYALPFLKQKGLLIAYKSIDTEHEIAESKNALNILGGKIKSVEDVSYEDNVRKLIFVQKNFKTPNKYPRSGNKPRLMPL
ncbi:MAG: 16S rRNA (guanine(527)-N(7))-methyltransferase RsmG [Clostridia bacterium]|nr:16S rRNA (guanine(527)-N(7))-methyltransferase RsmG [Clostridia bacterium]